MPPPEKLPIAWRTNIAVGRLEYGDRQRLKILVFLASDPKHGEYPDAKASEALGMKLRTFQYHLKILRDSGRISIVNRSFRYREGWSNLRTMTVTDEGLRAIPEGEIRQQGNLDPGTGAEVAHPPDDADLL